jgi:hypothetical protein
MRNASPAGTAVTTGLPVGLTGKVPSVATGADVIGLPNDNVNCVVVRGEFASKDPVIVIPDPTDVGSEVCELRFVCNSPADGVLLMIICTWAKLLDADAIISTAAITPKIHLLDFILYSPFEVVKETF